MATACLLAAGVLAGCGHSAPSAATSSSVSVSGAFGQAPHVGIPSAKAGTALTVRTVVHGSGPVFQRGDSVLANSAVYIWSGISHRLLLSTYGKEPALFGGQLLPGLEKSLTGQKMGSRVLAVVPPKDGYGPAGNAQNGVKGTDTLVFVVDLITSFSPKESASGHTVSTGGGGLPTVTSAPGAAPKITVPAGKPPSGLVVKTLVKGTGPAAAKGDMLIVQYEGVLWRTGQPFPGGSSWTTGQPFNFKIGVNPSQVITGWDQGLLGQTQGSRVLIVVPPADGYGSSGSPQAGIKGTDTLVFAVDILDVVPLTQTG
ncbi:MAG TPA: FKBP-type peptidyl-prolyl cis-trans isomerase [Streptosporangiaceae bacterium]|nr:FKBP-type peptidyl-prolyl cis-trans isomerase [Streptosporangiaceae bacterium]